MYKILPVVNLGKHLLSMFYEPGTLLGSTGKQTRWVFPPRILLHARASYHYSVFRCVALGAWAAGVASYEAGQRPGLLAGLGTECDVAAFPVCPQREEAEGGAGRTVPLECVLCLLSKEARKRGVWN